MTLDLFLMSSSIALIVVSAVLIAMLFMLNKSLIAFTGVLGGLQRDLSPIASDVRTVSLNVAELSQSLNNGMQRVSRMTETLGKIGDDLEEGRQAVKGGLETLGHLTGPWLGMLKLFGRK